MRIGKIASSAEYQMEKQFQNLLIFIPKYIKIMLSKFKIVTNIRS